MASQTGGEKEKRLKIDYMRIVKKFWSDTRRLLPTEGKLILVHILTGIYINRIGLFSFSVPGAADDLNMDVGEYEKHFGNAIQKIGWKYDREMRVIFIPSWWKYNHPSNPKQFMGSLKDLVQVPETYLISEWAANLAHLKRWYHPHFQTLIAPRLAMMGDGAQLEIPCEPQITVLALPADKEVAEPEGYTEEVETIYSYAEKIFYEVLAGKKPKGKKAVAKQKDALRLLLDRDGADGKEILKVLDFLATDVRQTTSRDQFPGWGAVCKSFTSLRRLCKDGDTKFQHIVSEMERGGPGSGPSINNWE